MPDPLALHTERLLCCAALATGGAVLAFVFARLHRAHPAPHLRLWAAAWLCVAFEHGAACLALPAADAAAAAVMQLGHYLQAAFMLLGTAALLRRQALSARRTALLAGAVAAATAAATLATAASPPDVRLLVRHEIRHLLTGLGFATAAVLLAARARGADGRLGRTVVIGGFAALGAAGIGRFVAARAAPDHAWSLPLVHDAASLFLQPLLAVGLVTWALERQQAVTRERGQELYDRTRQLLAAQKMEAIGRLAGGAAHDFNNVLTVVFGIKDQLQQMPGLPPAAAQCVRELDQAAGQAARLTSQLMMLTGRRSGEPQVFDLRETVHGMIGILRRLVGERLALAADLPPAPAHVRLQPGHAEQILLNLVVNARDAIAGPGTVRIGIAREGDTGRQRIVLTVRDDGEGMSAEVRQRALEPFFTTKGPGGTGLGLSLVHGIVRQSGGSVTIESAAGEGTTVRIAWPEAEAAPTAAADPPLPAAGPGHGNTILLAEDEPAVLEVTARTLQLAGYRVLPAASVTEALDLAGRHTGPIHALLTDVMMPGMSGPELAAAVARMRPGLKVLFVSGYVDSPVRASMGADAPLLGKPFTRHQLLSYLQANLAGASRDPVPP